MQKKSNFDFNYVNSYKKKTGQFRLETKLLKPFSPSHYLKHIEVTMTGFFHRCGPGTCRGLLPDTNRRKCLQRMEAGRLWPPTQRRHLVLCSTLFKKSSSGKYSRTLSLESQSWGWSSPEHEPLKELKNILGWTFVSWIAFPGRRLWRRQNHSRRVISRRDRSGAEVDPNGVGGVLFQNVKWSLKMLPF